MRARLEFAVHVLRRWTLDLALDVLGAIPKRLARAAPPVPARDRDQAILSAIFDPGRYLPRDLNWKGMEGMDEPMIEWQARAVAAVLDERDFQ